MAAVRSAEAVECWVWLGLTPLGGECCWWFRNPARQPVDTTVVGSGSISIYDGFKTNARWLGMGFLNHQQYGTDINRLAVGFFQADSLEIRMTAMQQPGSQIVSICRPSRVFFLKRRQTSLKVSSCPSQVQWCSSVWSSVRKKTSCIITLVIHTCIRMDVSENSGTSKSSILIGFSIINHPFWGTPILETPKCVSLSGFDSFSHVFL